MDTDSKAHQQSSKHHDCFDQRHGDDNVDMGGTSVSSDHYNDVTNDDDDDDDERKANRRARKVIEHYISNVFSIIGHFDLDPNRVLDIIIDIYELHPYNFAYIYLLQKFRKESIAHIVGFKYSFYHIPRSFPVVDNKEKGKDSVAASSNINKVSGKIQIQVDPSASVAQDVNSSSSSSVDDDDTYDQVTSSDTPRSLYIITAMLIMYDLIAIEDMIPYLKPSIQLLQDNINNIEENLKKEIISYGVVNLTATSNSSKR